MRVDADGWMRVYACIVRARVAAPGLGSQSGRRCTERSWTWTATTWRVGRGTWDVVCRTWRVGRGLEDVVRVWVVPRSWEGGCPCRAAELTERHWLPRPPPRPHASLPREPANPLSVPHRKPLTLTPSPVPTSAPTNHNPTPQPPSAPALTHMVTFRLPDSHGYLPPP